MRKRVSATDGVLGLLCVMYFITYLDRVNIATAGAVIIQDLGMSNTQFGLILSAFAYPYAVFQVIGGSIGLCLLGAGLAFTMHPERPFEGAGAATPPAGAPVPAGE